MHFQVKKNLPSELFYDGGSGPREGKAIPIYGNLFHPLETDNEGYAALKKAVPKERYRYQQLSM
jgi:hypothetical protein